MQPGRTKQLRLGKLKEVNVSAVKDNARGVDVAPTHALFNGKSLVIGHLRLRQELEKRVIKLLRPLEIRNMSGMVQHHETRIANRVMHLLTVGNRSDRVFGADENQRRNGDLW